MINIDCFLQIRRLVFQSKLKKDSFSFFPKKFLTLVLDGLAKFNLPNSQEKTQHILQVLHIYSIIFNKQKFILAHMHFSILEEPTLSVVLQITNCY